jgi:transposase
VIGPTGAVRVMMATRPVDFRKGVDGLAALVRDSLGADPFCGTVYVFRAKRPHRTSFRIPFGVRAHRLPLASTLWAAPAGRTAHHARSG